MADRVREQGYRGLIAWQKAMDLVVAVYQATNGWPKTEQYGLTDQARRAAVSIPSNIAEGNGRSGPREFLHHLSVAHGSLCELETHLLIAQRLAYADEATLTPVTQQAKETGRVLRGLMQSLR